MIKRNIYKWHRWLSVSMAIPVLMWIISGIMHPIMTSFKPLVKKQFLESKVIDTSKIHISLKNALQTNKISSILNFRIIELDKTYYYQVKLKERVHPVYISATDGTLNLKGDYNYAIQIAKQMLGDTSSVKNVSVLYDFDEEYVYVNRFLPVYKVHFNRADGIRLYIDTDGAKMALAMDNSRRAFNKFFVNFHSFGFLNCFGNFRLVVLVGLSMLSFITAVFGIYIWFVVSRKNKKQHDKTKHKKWHAKIAIYTAITTLGFTFSGALHAYEKFKPDNRNNYCHQPEIQTDVLDLNIAQLFKHSLNDGEITNVSIVSIDEKLFWQIYHKGKKGELKKNYRYISDFSKLYNGDSLYASFIANKFSGNKSQEIIESKEILKFQGEYGFVNKRLPVVKVQYNKNDNERYYIDTSTGKLSLKVQDKDLLEGYSFSMLHKYHFLDFFGKLTRDIATVIAASANLLVTLIGILLFVKFIINKKTKKIV